MSKATVYPIVPEICQFCDEGLAWMTCYDEKFRCRVCVHRHAEEMGWDEVPERLKKTEVKSTMPVLPAEPPKPQNNTYQPEMF